jgi:hypothetical protein
MASEKMFSSFVVSETTAKMISSLPKEKQLVYLWAVINYGLYGIEPIFEDVLETTLWIPMKDFIDMSKGKDTDWHNRQRRKGSNGGAPLGNQNAKKQPVVLQNNQNKTTHNENENVNGNGNVNLNDNDNKKEKEVSFFSSYEEQLNPNLKDVSEWLKSTSGVWNELKIGPPFAGETLQLNPENKKTILKAAGVYKADFAIGAMRNIAEVLRNPDLYDPGGCKGYTFVSFLQKGVERYNDKADPLETFRREGGAGTGAGPPKTPPPDRKSLGGLEL